MTLNLITFAKNQYYVSIKLDISILFIYIYTYNLQSKSLESRVILAHRLFCQYVRL